MVGAAAAPPSGLVRPKAVRLVSPQITLLAEQMFDSAARRSPRTDEEELNKNSGFDASPMPSMPERFHASPVPERLPVLVAEPRARSC
jgi:hypothetical protein